TIPPPASKKIPSADPVKNIAGFAGNLRDYLYIQEKQVQEATDAVNQHKSDVLTQLGFKSKGSGTSGSLGSSALSGLDLPPLSSSSVAPLNLPKNMISSADVQKLLASVKSKNGGASGPSSVSMGAPKAGSGISSSSLPPLAPAAPAL